MWKNIFLYVCDTLLAQIRLAGKTKKPLQSAKREGWFIKFTVNYIWFDMYMRVAYMQPRKKWKYNKIICAVNHIINMNTLHYRLCNIYVIHRLYT